MEGQNFFDQIRQTFVSVIVPVFNEGPKIALNLETLIHELESTFDEFEVIIVSDGSTDQTNFNIINFKHSSLKYFFPKKNKGKGQAIRLGFSKAKGEVIFFIDGGMEIHPKEIPLFYILMNIYHADIVLGSKRHPQSQIYYPAFRKFLSFCYQILIKLLFKINITDSQVGLKLYRREVVEAILPELKIDRYGFDIEVFVLAKLHGFHNFLEAPIRIDYFLNNKRPVAKELFHVFKISLQIISDTVKIFLRLKRLEKSHQKQERNEEGGSL